MASDTHFGGYDVQFVDRHRELSEKYMCVICRMVPRDVHQLTCCGKLICHHCIEDYKRKSSHNCPVCRRPNVSAFHDLNRNQEIMGLKVFCYYKEHSCSWTGELRDLIKEHALICVYKLVKCDQCGTRVPDKTLGDHLASACVKRMFWCQYCKESGSFEFIQNTHLDQCPEHPIECPNGCRATIRRKEIEAHRNVCMQQLVHCCYHPIGCNIMVKRMLKAGHEANCPKKGVKSLAQRKDTLPINICIDNFKSRMENKEVWEQDFFTKDGGYFMTLKVHLVSWKSDNAISCYFHMRAGPHDSSLSWPFRGVFVLELINQKKDENHYSKEIKFLTTKCDSYNSRLTSCDKAAVGIGEPEYVTHSFLSQCTQYRKYLEDNKMILRVSIKGTDNCKSAIGFFGCR